MLSYPITTSPDTNGMLLVLFPDIPEAVTAAENKESAIALGLDVLEATFTLYFDERRSIPMPSKPMEGQMVIRLSDHMASEVLRWNEMLAQETGKRDDCAS